MRGDDRDDPFGDIFDEIERMMNQMTGTGTDAGTVAAETHVDVHDEGDAIRLVADLPGVEREDIDLKCDGRTLTIDAASGNRRYDERVRLPVRVDEHSADATFNNGVLEIAFAKADDSASIDVD